MAWMRSMAPDILRLLKSDAGRRKLGHAVRMRVSSRRQAIGLRRDLGALFTIRPAKIPLDVRPMRSGESLPLIADVAGLDPRAAQERVDQRLLVDAHIPTCWVAVDGDGVVCYMQWLIAARDNARIRQWWGDLFPVLQPDEALLEGAYTADTHRGLGVMAHAMAVIAERAADAGARQVITFVGRDNIASLKGCERAGFTPYVERTDNWSLFRRRVEFGPLTSTQPGVRAATPTPPAARRPTARRRCRGRAR